MTLGYPPKNPPVLSSGKPRTRSGARAFILLAGFFAASLSDATAATYYIDSIAGAEANDGTTPVTPWKSLAADSKVNTVTFQPGDEVLFKRGAHWSGTFIPKGSGTAGNPIVFGAYGPPESPAPLIVGAGGAAIRLWNKSHVTIRDFELTNPGATAGTRNGIHIAYSSAGIFSGLKILNNEIHDVHGYTTRGGGANYSTGAIYLEFPGGTATSLLNDILIEGNYIHDTRCIGIQLKPAAFMTNQPDRWIKKLVIRGNLFETTGADHILVQGADAPLIEYNAGYDCGILAAPNADLWIAGMWVCYFTRDSLFQFNEVARTRNQFVGGLVGGDSQAFDVDYGTIGNHVFQYNYTHDNAGGVLLMMPPPGKASGGHHAPVEKTVVYRYNISVNDDRTTLSGRQLSLFTAPGINSGHIYNNVFFNNLPLGFRTSDSVAEYYTNNIFHAALAGYGTQPRFSHNLYSGHQPRVNDAYKIVADPKFVGPLPATDALTTSTFVAVDPASWADVTEVNKIFQLQPGSPAINRGKPVTATFPNGGRDFWGNPLYSGAPDIGAHEVPNGAGPAAAAVTFIDNVNAAPLTYSTPISNWTFHTDKPNYDNSTVAATSTVGSSVQVAFTGTNLTFVSSIGPDAGLIEISIDGGAPVPVDLYWPAKLYRQEVFQATGLAPGKHTLKVTLTGKNPASSASGLLVDYFYVLPVSPPAPPTVVRIDDAAGTFTGTWTPPSKEPEKYFNKTLRSSSTVGDSFEFTFTGTGVRIYGPRSNARGNFTVTVNGITRAVTSYTPGSFIEPAARLVEINGLPQGTHKLRGVITAKDPDSSGNAVGIDFIEAVTSIPARPVAPKKPRLRRQPRRPRLHRVCPGNKPALCPFSLARFVSKSRLLLAAALCLGAPAAHAADTAPAEPPVMTVNGEPVSAREYRLVMQRHTAAIYGQFSRDKKLEDHPAYWSPDSGPEGPLAKLRELTASELVKIKVSQLLARQYGLVSDISFEAFLQKRETENARRATAVQTGQVIYGPQHYRLSAYYYIQLRDLEFQLKQTMTREFAGKITDTEIQRTYTENEATLGKKPLPEIRLGIIEMLSERKASAQLERLRTEATVKIDAAQLAQITPRPADSSLSR